MSFTTPPGVLGPARTSLRWLLVASIVGCAGSFRRLWRAARHYLGFRLDLPQTQKAEDFRQRIRRYGLRGRHRTGDSSARPVKPGQPPKAGMAYTLVPRIREVAPHAARPWRRTPRAVVLHGAPYPWRLLRGAVAGRHEVCVAPRQQLCTVKNSAAYPNRRGRGKPSMFLTHRQRVAGLIPSISAACRAR